MSGVTIDGSFATHASSPAGMAATENDYAGAVGSFARLTPNAANTSLTGIAGGADGRRLTIVNLGNAVIIVQNQDAGSAAANRIITTTLAATVIPAEGSMSLIYDATTQRWRQTS
jgi:hypothetical protein